MFFYFICFFGVFFLNPNKQVKLHPVPQPVSHLLLYLSIQILWGGLFFHPACRDPTRTDPGCMPSTPRHCHINDVSANTQTRGRHREETTNLQAAGAGELEGSTAVSHQYNYFHLVALGNSRCKQGILLWQREGFFLCIRAVCNTAILMLLY